MKTKPLDLIKTPLSGTNLIEASAGTGKTYTIERLFLRLILEKKLSGSEILVVTFTEAATEELRDRIRTTLTETIRTLVSGTIQDNVILKHILTNKPGTEQEILERLRAAVRTFDETSIFTIHGFCQRMLGEKAFESGTLFDTELVTEQSLLIQEIVDDFWRNNFYYKSSLFIDYALEKGYSPQVLFSLIPSGSLHHDLSVIPHNLKTIKTDILEKDYTELFQKINTILPDVKDEIIDIILHAPLNRNIYRDREKNISSWINAMEGLFLMTKGRPHAFADSKVFEKFAASKIARATTKGNKPPEHTFFTLCQNLKDLSHNLCRAFDHNLLVMKPEFLAYLRRELLKRKIQRNIQYFDDLLINLRNALFDKHKGDELAKSIRKKYRAALIDEFQDTDPTQWDIFRKIFVHKESILFLIGDPKQAIYSFRGADIFTYMKAAKVMKSQLTLDTNYRSNSELIDAVNTIFSQSDKSFIFEAIPFHPVKPCQAADNKLFTIKGHVEPPFQLWFVSREHEKAPHKPLAKGNAQGPMALAVAQEIARLLFLSKKGEIRVGKQSLKPEDIAVLVRTHKEADIIRHELVKLQIPCVLDGTENLFDTKEVLHVERILHAVSEPHRSELIKAALTTDLMGYNGEELEEVVNNDLKWDALIMDFRNLNEQWHRHGFMKMFRYFLSRFKIRQKLLAFHDGERRLTNVLHVAEVLQRISTESNPGVTALLEWFSAQRCPETPRLQEYQIRLESDEDAVRLVTIHKSKGLEYPVVFVPFVWQKSRYDKKDLLTFHSDEGGLTMAISNEEIEKNRPLAERELLAENMRLLYVALTRAKNRCYFLWGGFNKAETSAVAYLFHHKGDANDFLAKELNNIKKMTDEEILSDLNQLKESSHYALEISFMNTTAYPSYLSYETPDTKLKCRNFTGIIKKDWGISSFSALTQEISADNELPDRDSLTSPDFVESFEEKTEQGEAFTIFDFPRGAQPGTCLHAIFEDLDFTSPDPSGIVEKKLAQYNFEPLWVNIVSSMVKNVLTTALHPDIPELTLNRLTAKDRINEMGFYFPLSSLTKKNLSAVFLKYGSSNLTSEFSQEIEKLLFSPVRGFLKGFIDMVFTFQGKFYLVDWKSNYLGDTVKQYGQTELTQVMHDDYYILQYLIYTVALNQYLTQRVPEYNYDTHFGGVFYIFLRGVNPDYGPEYGVYHDRPEKKLVKELSRILIGKE